jgi:Holliday junction resolvasome RuvABC endonuclease subunit
MGSILVAGLDPAFAHFGIARMRLDLDALGLSFDRVRTIVTEKMAGKRKVVRQNSDDLRRARELHEALHEELAGCTVAFGEIPSGAQHARSALGFGVAIGVLASCKIPLIEVMPVETKLASVGTKTAEKPEIIAWAADMYPEAGWQRYEKDTRNKKGALVKKAGDLHGDNEHAADACAVIHAGIKTPEFKQLLALWKATAANRG